MFFGDWNNYIRYVKIKEHIFDSWTIDGRRCIALTKAEKIRKIQGILELKDSREDLYADLLKINASGETCCCLWRNLWMAAGLFFCPESQKIRDQDSLEQ